MGYKEAIEIAGAKVIAYKKFGSYQGDWIAKIEIDGQIKYIHDYYGSCTVCDNFEAEFYSSDDHECENDIFYSPAYFNQPFRDNCQQCQTEKHKLIEFGKKLIDKAISFEECIFKISENIEWDMEVEPMVNWLNKIR